MPCEPESSLPPGQCTSCSILQVAKQNMSMGELLAGLPSEVRVRIFHLVLGLSDSAALMRHWLGLAMVSQSTCIGSL